jgi:hypothetical protein
MATKQTTGPWMWTDEQWAEIVRCARTAVAIRQKTRIDRAMFRTSRARWLLADAMRGERGARAYERRVISLLHAWAPEIAAIAKAGSAA